MVGGRSWVFGVWGVGGRREGYCPYLKVLEGGKLDNTYLGQYPSRRPPTPQTPNTQLLQHLFEGVGRREISLFEGLEGNDLKIWRSLFEDLLEGVCLRVFISIYLRVFSRGFVRGDFTEIIWGGSWEFLREVGWAGKAVLLAIHTYIHTCMHACMHTCIHTYTHTYIRTYIHICMHAYIHACIHACIHAYIHACIHACIHTYIHAYIHA